MSLALLAAASFALEGGAYRLVDRAESRYDGPEIAVRQRATLWGPWSLASDMGAAGEFVGGKGTCIGEVSFRMGASWSVRPAAPWLHWLELEAASGVGVVYVRLYGSLFGNDSDPAFDAYAERWLPQAWLSVRLRAELTHRVAVVLASDGRALPSATFKPDHLPPGTLADFFPVYRAAHDFSTLGASLGLDLRF
jgi:hypothetical protein